MGRRVAGLDGDARLILGGRAGGAVRAQGVAEPLAGSEQPRAHRRGLDAEQLCDLGGVSLLDVGKMDDKAQILGKVCERTPHRVVAQVTQRDVLGGHRGQLAGIAAGLAVVKRVDATAPRAFLVVMADIDGNAQQPCAQIGAAGKYARGPAACRKPNGRLLRLGDVDAEELL